MCFGDERLLPKAVKHARFESPLKKRTLRTRTLKIADDDGLSECLPLDRHFAMRALTKAWHIGLS